MLRHLAASQSLADPGIPSILRVYTWRRAQVSAESPRWRASFCATILGDCSAALSSATCSRQRLCAAPAAPACGWAFKFPLAWPFLCVFVTCGLSSIAQRHKEAELLECRPSPPRPAHRRSRAGCVCALPSPRLHVGALSAQHALPGQLGGGGLRRPQRAGVGGGGDGGAPAEGGLPYRVSPASESFFLQVGTQFPNHMQQQTTEHLLFSCFRVRSVQGKPSIPPPCKRRPGCFVSFAFHLSIAGSGAST